jgi:dihydroflavonol-4-reductase
VASPFPATIPQHEDELIIPARDGALRVLKASRDAGVKRVVLTSSFAAIGYGRPPQQKPFDETNWTNPNGDDVRAYTKSKTIAERAAWDWVKTEGGSLELSVVNPVGVFGPVLGPDYSTSILLIQRLMDGAMPGCPRSLVTSCLSWKSPRHSARAWAMPRDVYRNRKSRISWCDWRRCAIRR